MKNKDNVNILSKRYPPFKKKKISHILIFFSNPLLLIKFFFYSIFFIIFIFLIIKINRNNGISIILVMRIFTSLPCINDLLLNLGNYYRLVLLVLLQMKN